MEPRPLQTTLPCTFGLSISKKYYSLLRSRCSLSGVPPAPFVPCGHSKTPFDLIFPPSGRTNIRRKFDTRRQCNTTPSCFLPPHRQARSGSVGTARLLMQDFLSKRHRPPLRTPIFHITRGGAYLVHPLTQLMENARAIGHLDP